MKKKYTSIKVKLRTKAISGNRQSLYLDFYPAIPHPETGELTRREFLGMYLFDKAKMPSDKQHNKDTEALAQAIRQKREMELNKGEVYSVLEKQVLKQQQAEQERGQRDFVAYFAAVADKRKGSNYDNWVSALHYLKNYTGGNLKFSNLTRQWCYDFRDYLTNAKSLKRELTLSTNTAVSYFNKFKACLKQAYKEGLLHEDLNAKIEGIKAEETHRQYLTMEELLSLVKTECGIPVLKQAAIFSALTGLRHSDLQKLVWKEVGQSKESGCFLQFRQQKTGGAEVQPISEDAYKWLGERKEPTDKVFEGLSYSAYQNRHLYTWLGAAGITKPITFHCFRHTYAVLMLSKGVAMSTLSKMMGHRDRKTTEIYAQVVDKSKRDAADLMKIDL